MRWKWWLYPGPYTGISSASEDAAFATHAKSLFRIASHNVKHHLVWPPREPLRLDHTAIDSGFRLYVYLRVAASD